eukprot:g42619.t1
MVWDKRPVICVQTGEIFPSVNAAAKHIGRSHSNVVEAIQKRLTLVTLHYIVHGWSGQVLCSSVDYFLGKSGARILFSLITFLHLIIYFPENVSLLAWRNALCQYVSNAPCQYVSNAPRRECSG